MFDIKPEIFSLLSTIPGVVRVSDEFPSADAAMPVFTVTSYASKGSVSTVSAVRPYNLHGLKSWAFRAADQKKNPAS